MNQEPKPIKIVPHSSESEMLVLSAMLTDSEETLDELGVLLPEYFFIRSHNVIFRAIMELRSKKLKADIFTVQDLLKIRGQLDEVGGYHYMSKVAGFGMLGASQHHGDLLREKYKLRTLIRMGVELHKKSYQGNDATEIIYESEAQLFQLAAENISDQNEIPRGDVIVSKRIEERRSGLKVFGIPSGLKSFDEPTGGYRKGEYYTFAAQPGYGKTSWAEQSACYAALNGTPVLFVSLEMSIDRVLERISSRMSGVPLWNYLNNVMKPEHFDQFEAAKNRIVKSPLQIICPIDLTGPEFRSTVRRFKRKFGIEMVVLDYLQKMKSKTQRDERYVIKEASSYVSDAIKESDVAGIIISQMNRLFDKDSRPRMSHLAESSQIEKDSDFIGFIWPEKPRNQTNPHEANPIVLTIEKNRDGPSGNDQNLLWDGKVLTFKEREEKTTIFTGEYYEHKV